MASKIPHNRLTRCRAALLAPAASAVFVGLVLAAHAALAFHTAERMSVTHDEYWHLPVGLLSWKSGRFDYDDINPPLLRMWAALPLLFTAAETGSPPRGADSLVCGDRFLEANKANYNRFFLLGRSMIIALSVATGVVIAVWSRELFGRAASYLAVVLWAACPNVLAHASLVTTDLGTAFFFAATMYSLWRFARRPSWTWALLFGAALGLAQISKFTSLLLFPLAAATWFIIRSGNGERTARRTLALQWAAALVLCLFAWNAGYLFRGSFSTLGSYQFRSQALMGLHDRFSWLRWLPVPLPRDYLHGLDGQRHIMEGRHPVFLDGDWDVDGYPHYYVMALVYKLPHSLQAMMLLAAAFVWRPGDVDRKGRTQVLLLLPVAGLVGLASLVGMQLGVRYVLPAFPFLVLFAGQAARWARWQEYPARTICIAAAALLIPLALRYHPHHLAYFNELAGGPVNGRWHLLDSNLDWGQDLRAVNQFMAERRLKRIGLAYFGSVPPAAMGINYRLPPWDPAVGWYAVSVNFVQGRPHSVRAPDGSLHHAVLDEYGYFRLLNPVARIGYSIDVYYVSKVDLLHTFPSAAAPDGGKRLGGSFKSGSAAAKLAGK
jgi:4-amino-4-deoxy-L-arabinose transferase-like glycosyltransferase